MPEPPGRDRTSSVLAKTRATVAVVWRRPSIRWNFCAWFLGQGARAIVDAYLPLRIAQIAPDPVHAIGFVLGVYGALTAAATWLFGRLIDETGGVRWFVPTMIGGTIATLGLAIAPELWLLAPLAWSRSVAFAAVNTLLYAHLARLLPPGEQTPVMALTPVPRNVAAFALPLLAAAVAPFGVPAALLVGAASYGGCAIVGWLLVRATAAEREPDEPLRQG
jgi:predicted MFS family arabinose efflux permease